MQNSELRFSVTLDVVSKTLKITDTNTWGSTGQKCIIKITNLTFGTIVYKNAGFDTSDFSLPDISLLSSKYIILDAPLDSNDNILCSSYLVDYIVKDGTDIYVTNNTFEQCYNPATINLEVTSSCSQSIITSEDKSDYLAEFNGVQLYPSDKALTHWLQAPIKSSYIVPAPADVSKIILPPNIWTGVWQSSIETALVYDVKKWSNTDSSYWYFVTDVISATINHKVLCTTCYCELESCSKKLYNDFVNALSSNPESAKWYMEAITKMNSLWMQLQMALTCGTDTDSICNQMALILSANDCGCTLLDNSVSKEILPITIGEYSGIDLSKIVYTDTNQTITGSKVFDSKVIFKATSGIAFKVESSVPLPASPNDTMGVNGDVLRSDTAIYIKINGVWGKFDITYTW